MDNTTLTTEKLLRLQAQAMAEAANPKIFTTRTLPDDKCCQIDDRWFIHPVQLTTFAYRTRPSDYGNYIGRFGEIDVADADKMAVDAMRGDLAYPTYGLSEAKDSAWRKYHKERGLQAFRDIARIAQEFGTNLEAVLRDRIRGTTQEQNVPPEPTGADQNRPPKGKG